MGTRKECNGRGRKNEKRRKHYEKVQCFRIKNRFCVERDAIAHFPIQTHLDPICNETFLRCFSIYVIVSFCGIDAEINNINQKIRTKFQHK